MSTRRPSPGSFDEGAAMIIALVWAAVLSLVAGAVVTAVFNQVRPSDRTDRSYQALAAAEAGIEDVRARLAANTNYWQEALSFYDDPVTNAAIGLANPALAGWAKIPGGDSAGEFTYWLDTADAQRNGRVRVVSTGRSEFAGQEVTRTVEALLIKRTAANYVYVSNTEAFPWDSPGVYGPPGETSPDGLMSKDVARALCGNDGVGGDRYWYQWTNWDDGTSVLPRGPATAASNTNPTITGYGPHRNSAACLFGRITSTDRWVGDMHTNDVWYLEANIPNIDPMTSGNSNQVFTGRISSSCPGESAGAPLNGTCRDDHRWINPGRLPSASQLGKDPTTYYADEIPNDPNENNKLWNPVYESPLEMPTQAEIAKVRQLAVEDGCVFTGPTRVRFGTSGSTSYIQVTSPNTVETSNAFCGGTTLRASNANLNPTIRLNYDEMIAAGFNGVLFIDGASNADWPATSTDTTPPSCRNKSNGGPYPFVVPDPAVETVELTTGSPLGFPSAVTAWSGNPGVRGKIDEWTDSPLSRCWEGDLYLDAPANLGGYTGQFTVAAQGDIVFTDDLVEASVVQLGRSGPTSGTLWGVPSPSSINQLGLLAGRYAYVYHLEQQAGGNLNRINSLLSDLLLNMALLAPDKCLTVQDFKSQPAMGTLRVVGSIGQDSRCRVVGDSAGYKEWSVVYDDRLRAIGPPPYMSELSLEPWNLTRRFETVVRRDQVAKTESGMTLLRGSQARGTTAIYDAAGGAGTLQYVRVVSGGGQASIVEQGGVPLVRFIAPSGVASTRLDAVVRLDSGALVGREIEISTTG